MAKGVLFIADSYHYSPSPNGNCIESIANVLVGRGVDVSIVAMRNQFADGYEKINGVSVYRVCPFPEWEMMYKKSSPVVKKLKSGFYKAQIFLNKKHHPLSSKKVLDDLTRTADEIIRTKNIGVIVAVYRDAEDALAGLRLKCRHPDIKLIVYTLDSISGGVCSNPYISPELHIKKCRELELELLESCDYFCPMKTHSAIFESDEFLPFKEKIRYMDVPSLILDDTQDGKEHILNHNDLNLVFTGNMSKTNADSTYFLKLLPELTKRMKLHVDLYGGVSEDIKRTAQMIGVWDSTVRFHGNVSRQELVEIRERADVFLNFGNEHPCGIPCKIFEYLACDKPILSFYKIQEDASRKYLQDEPMALLISEASPPESAICDIVSFINGIDICRVDSKRILARYGDNTPYPIAELIQELI